MPNRRADRAPPEASPPAAADDSVNERSEPGAGASFPIVGVGASAGGLDAFTQLLKALPADSGMAFVLVQHLAPSHPSALVEILSRTTNMPVTEVQDEPPVEPNHVYVIPPNCCMGIAGGALQLTPREQAGNQRVIDHFLRALAKDRRHQAIGVVLSGTASDGTVGLQAIKTEGGITFAQDDSAQHDGMPHSAIASGCVDFVLPPDEIARELVRIAHHPYAMPETEAREADSKTTNLASVAQLLRHATGVDFTHYKFNTFYRRIARRMVLQKMDRLDHYLKLLRQTPAEVDALYHDVLINVTSFFRDPEAFEALKDTAFPRLIKLRSGQEPVRMWTLGCSTGQEAYSLAMAFTEFTETQGNPVPLQLFGTDLNAGGVDKARAGVYPKDIVEEVTPGRLRRFFATVDGGYRISKTIRDMCVFSRQNVLTDPPFSRMDLISCRNLLIYLEPVLQQRVLPVLHYALKPAGCLWLGGSETIGAHRNLFEAQDPKHKIYTKKTGVGATAGLFPVQRAGAPRVPFVAITAGAGDDTPELYKEAERILLNKFAPPGVLVSADLEILQYRGDTEPYLTPAPGKASLNLLKMLRQGLLVAVRAAIRRSAKEQIPVREEGLRVRSGGEAREVALEVIPIKGHAVKGGGFLVMFEQAGVGSAARQPDSAAPYQPATPDDADNARLQQELSATRDYLQSVIEQQEVVNEELQSAIEEVQSANEELQSTNEELETSKEEIESGNEELATVNDELNIRNTELSQLSNDLANLLASTQMAIVMLGPDLRVRRFTPAASSLLNLLPTDVGRPLGDIKLNLDNLSDLEPLLSEVLDTASVNEREVRDKYGHWYSLRLRPYKTLEHKIDGVVLMLVDVGLLNKRAQEDKESIVATVREPLVVLDADLRVRTTNDAFYRTFGVKPVETEGSLIYELGNGQWNIPELRRLLEEVLPRDNHFNDFAVEHEFEHIGKKTMLLNARRLLQLGDRAPSILLAIEDITERKRAEALRESHARLQSHTEELSRSEALFSTIVDQAPNGMYVVDAQFRVQQVNSRALPVFGAVHPLIGRDFSEVMHILWGPEVGGQVVRIFRHTLETGERYISPGFSERRDDLGVEQSYEWEVRRVTLPDGVHGVICYFTDITERKRAEEAMARMAAIVASSDEAIISKDLGGSITSWNRGAERLFGYTAQEAVGRPASILIPPDREDDEPRILERIGRGESTEHYETVRQRKDGSLIDISLTVSPIKDAQGRIIGASKIVRDITERKQAEAEIKVSLEKTVLLNEIHHRVKNNLQIIHSLLDLQAARIEDAATVAVLRDSQHRIQSMALIHQTLYQSHDFAQVNFGSFAKTLTQYLRDAYPAAAERVALQVEAAEDVLLPLNTAIPCGLIVNELVSNALKHAFPGKARGQVRVEVAHLADGALIAVSDNGAGIPPDRNLETDATLGLQLIRLLTEQIGATLEIRRAAPTRFALTFSRLAEKTDQQSSSREAVRAGPPIQALGRKFRPGAGSQ